MSRPIYTAQKTHDAFFHLAGLLRSGDASKSARTRVAACAADLAYLSIVNPQGETRILIQHVEKLCVKPTALNTSPAAPMRALSPSFDP